MNLEIEVKFIIPKELKGLSCSVFLGKYFYFIFHVLEIGMMKMLEVQKEIGDGLKVLKLNRRRREIDHLLIGVHIEKIRVIEMRKEVLVKERIEKEVRAHGINEVEVEVIVKSEKKVEVEAVVIVGTKKQVEVGIEAPKTLRIKVISIKVINKCFEMKRNLTNVDSQFHQTLGENVVKWMIRCTLLGCASYYRTRPFWQY